MLRSLWREGGLPRMYRGLSYTLLRAAPTAATLLPTYEFVLERLQRVM